VLRANEHDLLIAVAVLSVILVFGFYEIIFGGKTLAGSSVGVMGSVTPLGAPYGYPGLEPLDAYHLDPGASGWLYESQAAKVHQLYEDFKLPLWNANQGTGGPFLGDMLTPALNLFYLPAMIFNSPLSLDVYLLGRFLLGGLFAFMFARSVGLCRPASLTVSVGLILCGFCTLFVNNNYLDVYLTVPLSLYAIEQCLQKQRPRYSALLALSIAMNFFAQLPEGSFVAVLFVGGYGLYRLAVTWYEDRDRRVLIRRFVLITVGLAGGAGLALPATLPFMEFVNNAYSSHNSNNVFGLSHDSPKFINNLFIPYLDGLPGASVSGGGAGWTSTRNWVGMVLPFFALLGLFDKRLGRKVAWFFVFTALLGFSKSYGAPLVNDLGRLPLAKLTLFNQWLAPLNAFSVAMVAGVGVDRVFRGERLGWSLHAALGGLFLILLWALRKHWILVEHMPHESRIWFEIAIGLPIIAWLVVWAGQQANSMRQGWLCLALISAELLLLLPHGVFRERYDRFTKPPYIQYLQDRQMPERPRLFGLDGILYADSASAYNLDDIRYLDGQFPDRFFDYVKQFVSPLADRFVGHDPQPVAFSDNRYFDLMGVRYLIAGKAGLPAATTMADEVVKKLGKTPQHDIADYTIDGEKKHVLAANAPSVVPLELRLTPTAHVLRFSPALNPEAWEKVPNGVTFQVWASEGAGIPEKVIYSRLLNPAVNPDDRHWLPAEVDLAPLGARPSVSLRVIGAGGSPTNQSGWGDVSLAGTLPQDQQFRLVYDEELRLYQNLNAYPRAFAVHRAEEVKDQKAALAAMKRLDIDFRKTAVLEGRLTEAEKKLLATAPELDGSRVSIRKYEDMRVELRANMQSPGIVVLTDTHYPGWKAYLDGKRVDIHLTDYVFRGVVVPAGEHTIVYKYDPASFKLGAAAAILTVLGFAGWFAYTRYREKKLSAWDLEA
jgi:hypothetical protein